MRLVEVVSLQGGQFQAAGAAAAADDCDAVLQAWCGGLRHEGHALAPRQRARHQDASIHLGDLGLAAEGHRQIEFLVNDLKRLGDPGFSQRAKAVQECASNLNSMGS